MRGCGHTKTGHGSQRPAQNSFKTTSLFDYWQLCNGNGLWNQWTCVTQRELNLSGSSCLFLLSVCLFLSPDLPLLLLFDGHFPNFRTGWTEMLASFLPVHVATCFISLCLSLVDKWSSPVNGGSPLSLLITWSKKRNEKQREGTGSQSCHS